jgi:iron complex outermembrane receptor protein
MNNSLSDSAYLGTEFILDVDLIERVEIIRGPGSSLYGNNAFFGVINVITRTGAKFPGHGVEVSGEAAASIPTKQESPMGSFQQWPRSAFFGSFYDNHGQDRLFL